MLRHRIIPLVLLDGYSVVKTIRFDIRRNLGNPIVVSRVYNSRNVDELILLDIDASKENRKIDLMTVQAVAKECYMPLTVGGGLRTRKDIESVLKVGADKVALNTVFFENPSLIKEAVSVFGSQCIVASLDVKKDNNGNWQLFSHAKKSININFEKALNLLDEAMVGEILINSVDLDGTLKGFDQALIDYVCLKVKNIPIIAAGGASSEKDCVEIIQHGASAAAAASIFHFSSITPMSCKQAMAAAGLPVRLV